MNELSKFIKGNTLTGLIEKVEKRSANNLIKNFRNCEIEIKRLITKVDECNSLSNAIKFHRQILDFELIRDCILESFDPLEYSQEMLDWQPFPFDDDSAVYLMYKQLRFKYFDGESLRVSDDAIRNILRDRTKIMYPSEDYSEVIWNRNIFYFTPMQASAVRFMNGLHEEGKKMIFQGDIMQHIESSTEFLKDIFKNHNAWKTLIIKEKNSYYRLDIE